MKNWFRHSLLLCLLTPAWAFAAPELTATMLVDGKVGTRLALPPIFAKPGDFVLAFNANDGQLLGQGQVVDGDGRFVLELSLTSAFNQTPVALELQRGRVRYRLLENGRPAEFAFQGGILPRRLSLNPRLGEVTAVLPDLAAAQGATRASREANVICELDSMDVNQDGICDEQDLALLALFGGGVTRTVGAAP